MMSKEELRLRASRIHRDGLKDEHVRELQVAQLNPIWLNHGVHEWFVALMRSPDEQFAERVESPRGKADEVTRMLREASKLLLGNRCLYFSYNLDEAPGFEVDTLALMERLVANPVLTTMDGCVIADRHASSVFVLDYEMALDQGFVDTIALSGSGRATRVCSA